jgi:hypothetical protein
MDTEIWTGRYGHGNIKRKTKAQAILFNPFTVANGSLPFVRLLTKKQMKVIRLQTV